MGLLPKKSMFWVGPPVLWEDGNKHFICLETTKRKENNHWSQIEGRFGVREGIPSDLFQNRFKKRSEGTFYPQYQLNREESKNYNLIKQGISFFEVLGLVGRTSEIKIKASKTLQR